MKMSDAIRAGAKLGPQHFGGMFGFGDDSSCAMGAAFKGVYGDSTSVAAACLKGPRSSWFPEDWYYILDSGYEFCPLCKVKQNGVSWVITHLNDDHMMSREAIAEWVEVIESKLAQGQPTADEAKAGTSGCEVGGSEPLTTDAGSIPMGSERLTKAVPVA